MFVAEYNLGIKIWNAILGNEFFPNQDDRKEHFYHVIIRYVKDKEQPELRKLDCKNLIVESSSISNVEQIKKCLKGINKEDNPTHNYFLLELNLSDNPYAKFFEEYDVLLSYMDTSYDDIKEELSIFLNKINFGIFHFSSTLDKKRDLNFIKKIGASIPFSFSNSFFISERGSSTSDLKTDSFNPIGDFLGNDKPTHFLCVPSYSKFYYYFNKNRILNSVESFLIYWGSKVEKPLHDILLPTFFNKYIPENEKSDNSEKEIFIISRLFESFKSKVQYGNMYKYLAAYYEGSRFTTDKDKNTDYKLKKEDEDQRKEELENMNPNYENFVERLKEYIKRYNCKNVEKRIIYNFCDLNLEGVKNFKKKMDDLTSNFALEGNDKEEEEEEDKEEEDYDKDPGKAKKIFEEKFNEKIFGFFIELFIFYHNQKSSENDYIKSYSEYFLAEKNSNKDLKKIFEERDKKYKEEIEKNKSNFKIPIKTISQTNSELNQKLKPKLDTNNKVRNSSKKSDGGVPIKNSKKGTSSKFCSCCSECIQNICS